MKSWMPFLGFSSREKSFNKVCYHSCVDFDAGDVDLMYITNLHLPFDGEIKPIDNKLLGLWFTSEEYLIEEVKNSGFNKCKWRADVTIYANYLKSFIDKVSKIERDLWMFLKFCGDNRIGQYVPANKNVLFSPYEELKFYRAQIYRFLKVALFDL